MAAMKLSTCVKQWCLLAALLVVVCAVLSVHAQEDSSDAPIESSAAGSYSHSGSYEDSMVSSEEQPTTTTTTTAEPATTTTTTEEPAPTTTTAAPAPTTTAGPVCQVSGCEECVAGSSTQCSSCANGYIIQDDHSCKPRGNGGFAGPSAGVVAVLVSAAVALCL